jgi:hypothetical protein
MCGRSSQPPQVTPDGRPTSLGRQTIAEKKGKIEAVIGSTEIWTPTG